MLDMITAEQLKLYWANLNAVLRTRKDLTREEFHRLHNLPASTKDFTKTHMDEFLRACAAILQPSNLKPQLRAFDQPKTRLLHKINVEQAAQLHALDIPDPLAYIAKISQDKFNGRKPADLSESHHSIHGSYFSELEMLRNTIARTISKLRQDRGWTVHELLWNSGLGKTCQCAACAKVASRAPSRELATADNVPF